MNTDETDRIIVSALLINPSNYTVEDLPDRFDFRRCAPELLRAVARTVQQAERRTMRDALKARYFDSDWPDTDYAEWFEKGGRFEIEEGTP